MVDPSDDVAYQVATTYRHPTDELRQALENGQPLTQEQMCQAMVAIAHTAHQIAYHGDVEQALDQHVYPFISAVLGSQDEKLQRACSEVFAAARHALQDQGQAFGKRFESLLQQVDDHQNSVAKIEYEHKLALQDHKQWTLEIVRTKGNEIQANADNMLASQAKFFLEQLVKFASDAQQRGQAVAQQVMGHVDALLSMLRAESEAQALKARQHADASAANAAKAAGAHAVSISTATTDSVAVALASRMVAVENDANRMDSNIAEVRVYSETVQFTVDRITTLVNRLRAKGDKIEDALATKAEVSVLKHLEEDIEENLKQVQEANQLATKAQTISDSVAHRLEAEASRLDTACKNLRASLERDRSARAASPGIDVTAAVQHELRHVSTSVLAEAKRETVQVVNEAVRPLTAMLERIAKDVADLQATTRVANSQVASTTVAGWCHENCHGRGHA